MDLMQATHSVLIKYPSLLGASAIIHLAMEVIGEEEEIAIEDSPIKKGLSPKIDPS